MDRRVLWNSAVLSFAMAKGVYVCEVCGCIGNNKGWWTLDVDGVDWVRATDKPFQVTRVTLTGSFQPSHPACYLSLHLSSSFILHTKHPQYLAIARTEQERPNSALNHTTQLPEITSRSRKHQRSKLRPTTHVLHSPCPEHPNQNSKVS